MAKIGAPHGIKGEVRVKPFGQEGMALGDYGSLYTEDGRKFRIMRMRPTKNVLVVKFKGINFRDEAEKLNGLELYIDRSALPDDNEEDEFYVTDLIGCGVSSEEGENIGIVKDIPNFGAGDLIEISLSNTNETLLMEFSKQNVPEIDLIKRSIKICPPVEISEKDED